VTLLLPEKYGGQKPARSRNKKSLEKSRLFSKK